MKPQARSRKNRQPEPPFPEQKLTNPDTGLESDLRPRPKYKAPQYLAAGKLRGKVALITGGDSGIGRAVAVLFAREGADVAISYLPDEESDAQETRSAVEEAGQECLLLPGDLTDRAFCRQVVERTITELDRLDIVVPNAAHQMRKESLEEVSDEEWERTFQTNIHSVFRIVKNALPHLQRGSSIIVTSSETGIMGNKDLPDYSATKGAINALVKSLAQSLIDRGIRVNAVAPGPVWTPLNPADDGTSAKEVSQFGADTPMKRPAQPEEIAPAYVFLASEADSSYVTGVVLPEMGGETAA